jgi:hypothetical protein
MCEAKAKRVVPKPPAVRTVSHDAPDRRYVYTDADLARIGEVVARPLDRSRYQTFKAEHWEGVQRRAEKRLKELGLALTVEEAAAISGYTSQDYQFINPMLRGQGKKPVPSLTKGKSYTPEDLLPYINLIVSGLNQLPASAPSPVYRGTNLPQAVLQNHVVNAVVSDRAFLSTTGSEEVAYKPMGGKASMHRFTIEHRSGRDVTPLTLHLEENETLFLPGTRFKVVSRKAGQGGTIEFGLVEV